MINHALAVIGCLQATLDKDQGGVVAENLERFYGKLRAGLLQAQFRQSEARIRRQMADLVKVREAWERLEQRQAGTARPSQSQAEGGQPGRAEWKA